MVFCPCKFLEKRCEQPSVWELAMSPLSLATEAFKEFWRIGTRLDLESAQPETPTEIFSSEGLMLELYSS
jgi:hypothetical protein